jgi:hypothetical protein
MIIIIVTAVETSNLTLSCIVRRYYQAETSKGIEDLVFAVGICSGYRLVKCYNCLYLGVESVQKSNYQSKHHVESPTCDNITL